MGNEREHVSETFGGLLSLYRKPDGSEWGGQDLERATGGAVTRSYVANLKKARLRDLERDKDALLEEYAGLMPEALDALSAEERHAVYGRLRLRVVSRKDGSFEISGSFSGHALGTQELIQT